MAEGPIFMGAAVGDSRLGGLVAPPGPVKAEPTGSPIGAVLTEPEKPGRKMGTGARRSAGLLGAAVSGGGCAPCNCPTSPGGCHSHHHWFCGSDVKSDGGGGSLE